MHELQKRYGKDLRIVYKSFIVHPDTATIPARAACAAHLQGKFEQLYELIWDKGYGAGRDLSQGNMMRLARAAGLSMKKFETDRAGACVTRVQTDQEHLVQLGVVGTPAFYINGRFLSGARPLEQFTPIIDEELKKAKASGIAKSNYYNHLLSTGAASAGM
jgi:predicted DsbA family dithiol-disulfide isomerase